MPFLRQLVLVFNTLDLGLKRCIEKQSKINDFYPVILDKHFTIQGTGIQRGLAERLVKKSLEKNGWTVWRSALLGIEKSETYPIVKRKYEMLTRILKKSPENHEKLRYFNAVHHGMPDFICYKKGIMKFVECKKNNESLLHSQKRCFRELINMHYHVEIHRIASPRFKRILRNMASGEKTILEEQTKIRRRY